MSESLLNELNKFKDTYYSENKKKCISKESAEIRSC